MFDFLFQNRSASLQGIVNDPVIGPAIGVLNKIIGLNDPILSPSNYSSNTTTTNEDKLSEKTLDRIWDNLIPDEDSQPGILGEVTEPEFKYSCACTMEEVEINAPEKLVDYLLYC